jgi:hypothetical protein
MSDLPEGFELDAPSPPAGGGLPPGFTLDAEEPAPSKAPWLPYAQQQPIHSTDNTGWYKLRPDGSHLSVPAPNNANGIAFKDIPKRIGDIGREFADLASFHQANKLEAKVRSLFDNVPYEKALADEQAKSDAVPEAVKSSIGPLGLVASPVNKVAALGAAKVIPEMAEGLPALLSRYGRYGFQGGVLNSLYGATNDDPDAAKKSAAGAGGLAALGMVAPPEGGGLPNPLNDAIKRAGADFFKGAAFSVGGPALVEGGPAALKSLAAPILKRLNPEEAFFASLSKAADRANLTPDMLAAKTDKLGPAGMLANVGGQITDFARDIAQFPGRARQAAQAGFGAQQGSRFGTRGGAVARAENAINHNLTSDQARATIDGLVDLRSRSSSPIWRQMFATPRAADSPVLDVLAENPEVRRGMNIGQNTFRNSENAEGRQMDPAIFNINGKPTFQAWHAAKEGLDDILFSGGENIVNPTTGQLTKYGRSINDMRSSILQELQLQFPEYQDALRTWSGPTQAMRMVELGQQAAKGDARLSAELLEGMTPNERDFARIGFADQAKFLLSKTNRGGNVSDQFFKNQNAARNAELFYPSRQAFNDFKRSMIIEDKFHSSKNTILGGSPSAPRLAGMQDAADMMGEAVDGAKHGGLTGAAANLLSSGWNRIKAEPEAVRDFGAQYLFSTDPARRAYALDQMRRFYNSGNAFGAVPTEGLLGATPLATRSLFGP